MTKLRFMQLDVFSERAGGGNPLGVVIGASDWQSANMQRFAAWIDLVETTFVLPPRDPQAHYRLRIFTPAKEIPFAGHPTIGSAHAILECDLATPDGDLLVQECDAGLLPIRVDGTGADRVLFVRAPSARVLREGANVEPILSYLLRGIALGALPPAFVEGGRRWWVVEFASEETWRAWQPDHAAIGMLSRETDSLGLCAFARSRDADDQIVVRAFPAGVGIVEDPASGAANGLLAAWIRQREPDGALARGYRVSQGREIGRDAAITIRMGDDGAVWVGGRTHTVIDGGLRWPQGV